MLVFGKKKSLESLKQAIVGLRYVTRGAASLMVFVCKQVEDKRSQEPATALLVLEGLLWKELLSPCDTASEDRKDSRGATKSSSRMRVAKRS